MINTKELGELFDSYVDVVSEEALLMSRSRFITVCSEKLDISIDHYIPTSNQTITEPIALPEDNDRNNIENKRGNFYTVQDKQTKPILVFHTFLFNVVRGSTHQGKRPDKVIIHISYDQLVGITMGSANYRSKFHEWFCNVSNLILPNKKINIEVMK